MITAAEELAFISYLVLIKSEKLHEANTCSPGQWLVLSGGL